MNIRRTISFCARAIVVAIIFLPLAVFCSFVWGLPFLADFADGLLEKLSKKAISFHAAMDNWENHTPENTMELLKKDFKK